MAKPADQPRREDESGKAEKKAKAAWLALEGENLIAEASADWIAALQARDTEAARKIWCTIVETLFLRWAKQEGVWDGDEEAEKKIRGRGAPARLQEEQISPPVGPVEVGTADVHLRRLGNLVRRVQHLERLQRSAVRGQVESRRLWAKIRIAPREVLSGEQPIPLLAQRQAAYGFGGAGWLAGPAQRILFLSVC